MLAVTVMGPAEASLREDGAEIEATVDTGFTGALCLPPEMVDALGLPFVGRGSGGEGA